MDATPSVSYSGKEMEEIKRGRKHHVCTSSDAVSLCILVGARGFEPPTSSTPLKRATELRYAPTQAGVYHAAAELPNRILQFPIVFIAAIGRSTTQAGADKIRRAVEKCGHWHTFFSGGLDRQQRQQAVAGSHGDMAV